jgi:transcriptional regulator with XRE-family HTH domain
MPRPPKARHFVRDIRNALGWTQTDLADRIGVAPITVKRIENRTLKMSDVFATRLYWETGFNGVFAGLDSNGGLVFVHRDGKTGPYTKEDYADWRRRVGKSTEEERKCLAESLHHWIQILFDATQSPDRDLFHPVYHAVTEAIDRVCKDFRLEEKADKIINKRWERWGGHWNPAFYAPQVDKPIKSVAGSFTMMEAHLREIQEKKAKASSNGQKLTTAAPEPTREKPAVVAMVTAVVPESTRKRPTRQRKAAAAR